MILRAFAKLNQERSDIWHGNGEPWTGADWSNAMCGEAGEAANVVKKLRRLETGTFVKEVPAEKPELLRKLGYELADTLCYLTLLANFYGIDLELACAEKFNLISDQLGIDCFTTMYCGEGGLADD